MGLDWKQPEGRNQNKRDTPHLGLERTKTSVKKDMRSVVYVYHSKIQTEKQTTVSLKGVGTCCGNWWEDRPKHQDSFMEELHFLIQV